MPRHAVAVAAALALGACTVPNVDYTGKSCPCADGWVCDTVNNVCVAVAGADGPPGTDADGDAPRADASGADATPATSCLGSAPGPQRFVDHFDTALTGWTVGGGSWAVPGGGELIQSSTTAGLSFAYPNATANLVDYRVVTKLRQIAGGIGDAIEISFRTQTATAGGQYHCNWEPDNGTFLIQYTAPDGINGDVVITKDISLASIPGYDPNGDRIMELQVVGSQISCCLRDIPGATLSAIDTRYTTGGPGAKTYRMSAAYDDYTVYDP